MLWAWRYWGQPVEGDKHRGIQGDKPKTAKLVLTILSELLDPAVPDEV